MSGRPIVVLGGWLGCKSRFLRRYETMYQKLGFEVLSVVAEPEMVVDSSLSQKPIKIPDGWPAQLDEDPETMNSLALLVLGRIHNKQSAFFIFHAFSNGGCFLWESIEKVMDVRDGGAVEEPARNILARIRGKVKGLVFDSCPAWFPGDRSSGGLRAALQYCTPREKARVLMKFGPGVLFYNGAAEAKAQDRRCHDFFRNLSESALDIPHLFLYSTDDPLANAKHISWLFQLKKSRHKSPYLKKVWKKSTHCAHIREHPDEYTEVVEIFVAAVSLRSKL